MIKRILLAIITLALFGALPAQAQLLDDWEILDFHVDIEVMSNSDVFVTETIKVNLQTERHGIFRDIPYDYYDEFRQAKTLSFDFLSVTDVNGVDIPFLVTSNYGSYRVRIGDADLYVSGEQTYVIEYKVQRALGYFEEHDELYWDVTGNEWTVPIRNSSAKVTLPFDDDQAIKTRCFTGQFGSVDEDCEIVHSGNTAEFKANGFLTIVVGWPKGFVKEPTVVTKSRYFLQDNWGYLLPIPAFLIMYLLWRKFGDDPEDPYGLVTQFDPPEDLTPAEVGYLMHQKLKKSFLPAELVHLAYKGYIKIKEEKAKKAFKKDDYTLIKVKDFEDAPDLKEHQKMLLKGLFLSKDERKVSKIPTSFYQKVVKIKAQVLKQLKAKKYFQHNPQVVKKSYFVVGLFIMFSSASFIEAKTPHLAVGIFLSGLIVLIFSFIMSRRTKRGVLAYEHAQGFEQYIDIAEDRRVKWEEEKNLFFKYLPYAMIFGNADKWANAFGDMFKEPPEWFEGDVQGFSSNNFVRSMKVFSNSTVSGIRPPASSSSGYRSSSSGFSSGGFSGGGGGGGGGGSW